MQHRLADDPTAPATFAHPTADLTYEHIKRQPLLRGLINEYERAA